MVILSSTIRCPSGYMFRLQFAETNLAGGEHSAEVEQICDRTLPADVVGSTVPNASCVKGLVSSFEITCRQRSCTSTLYPVFRLTCAEGSRGRFSFVPRVLIAVDSVFFFLKESTWKGCAFLSFHLPWWPRLCVTLRS